jgi:hypothetical protein
MMFQFPEAVGVDPGLRGLRSLRCDFLLKLCEALLVIQNPFGIVEFKLKQVPFSLTLPASPKRARTYSLSLKTFVLKTCPGFLFMPLLIHRVVSLDDLQEVVVPQLLCKPLKHGTSLLVEQEKLTLRRNTISSLFNNQGGCGKVLFCA